jgi:glycosyltransferase involved in cell wall biosynthesis
LTTVHHALDVRIFHKECRSLAKAGWPVCLIARHERDETIDGVKVVSIAECKGRLRRATISVLAAFRKALSAKARIIHFHDPELIPVGLVLKLCGRRVVYDVHEDLPRHLEAKHWVSATWRRPLRYLAVAAEWIAGHLVDRIVTVTPEIAARFPKEKTVLIRNYPFPEELCAVESHPYGNRPNEVAYVGGISEARGAVEMVDALERVAEKFGARLNLAGTFMPTSLEDGLRKRPGWRHVDMRGQLGRAGVREVLSRSRVGLVVLHPSPNYVTAQPIKLYEYMSAGLPVIASDFPAWREIIEKTRSGILVDPYDTAAIADAIDWILSNPREAEEMGARGREAVLREFNWENEEKKLLGLYEALSA